MTTVGVLAVQGAFNLHQQTLRRCGVESVQVRTAEQLLSCDALVIPGGESTVISKMLEANDLVQALGSAVATGMPMLGTCAGMILLAGEIDDGTADQTSFSAIDITVSRNFYGRQIDSFESSIDLVVPPEIASGVDTGSPLDAVFIRAPGVSRVGDEVEVWAQHDGNAVLCRQGSVLVSSFHPELVPEDDRIHQLFLSLAG